MYIYYVYVYICVCAYIHTYHIYTDKYVISTVHVCMCVYIKQFINAVLQMRFCMLKHQRVELWLV